MVWQDTMVVLLRNIINDVSDTAEYSDGRLEEVLAVAAHFVIQELNFDYTYTVTVATCSISPDPDTNGDTAFMNLVVLKAACIIDQGQYRTKALAAGVKIRCGPAVLETLQHLKGFKELLEVGPCAAYETLKRDWQLGNARLCKAILSPFVGNNFDPTSLNSFTPYYGFKR